MQQFPKKADWLSFTLNFVIGLIVGCILGYITIRRRRGIWLHEDLIFPYLVGTSLICAGFATKLGDQLWIGQNYRVIPPDAPEHSLISKYLSISLIVCGFALWAFSLFKHFFG